MDLDTYEPEDWKIDAPENRAAIANMTALVGVRRDEKILGGQALVCNSFHSLLVNLGRIEGLIPREEGTLSIQKSTTRDTTIIFRMN